MVQKTDHHVSHQSVVPKRIFSVFPAAEHNHRHCQSTSLAAVEAHCKAIGARLTPPRRQVLDVLLRQHRAMGAYDIAERMPKDIKGRAPAPMTVYRALAFLQSVGAVHRIASLNAFVACAHGHAADTSPESPDSNPNPSFFICEQCAEVAEFEMAALENALNKAANEAGFMPRAAAIEVLGLCPKCQPQRTAERGAGA